MTLERFKESPAGPTVVLLAICTVIALALAAVYQATAPVIERVERELADTARGLVLPQGLEAGFSKIEGVALPEGVREAYAANNGAGYVFQSAAKGFDGDVVFMVGIDGQGAVTGIQMFDHNETPGLGTKVGKEEYLNKYYGYVPPGEVEAVTGATRTTGALKDSLRQALEAYEAVRGAAA